MGLRQNESVMAGLGQAWPSLARLGPAWPGLARLGPAIHVFAAAKETWMPGTSLGLAVNCLQPQRLLRPVDHRVAVEEREHRGLDPRGRAVRDHGGRDDHVAMVVEGERERRARGAAGHVVGAAASLHPRDRDRVAVARCLELLADELHVADPLELLVVGDAGRAIAEADLGAHVNLDLRAADRRVAAESAAEA